MKVLMFGWEFPPVISGGLGTVCLHLTQHLTARGVEVLMVIPCVQGERMRFDQFELRGADEVDILKDYSDLREEMTPRTLRLLEVDSVLRPYHTETSYRELLATTEAASQRRHHGSNSLGPQRFKGGYGSNLKDEVARYAVVAAELGLREPFDIIHAHDWMTFPAGIEAKRASGKPLICHIHATEFDRSGDSPNQAVYDIERYGLEQADRVLAVSQRTKNTLLKHYGLRDEKIHVVHNAANRQKQIDEYMVRRHLKEPVVLFLGRVTMQKGPDYFVEAARLVLQKIKNVRFVMAGSGDMLSRLVELVAYHRLQRKFHFTGFLRGPKVEQMFALSDLYVMPSVSEPFGVTPFEAMLFQVPVIVSKQAGVTEVLRNAITVDFWDTRKLADSILAVLEDDELAQRLIEQGLEDLEQLTWDKAAGKVAAHYQELTG